MIKISTGFVSNKVFRDMVSYNLKKITENVVKMIYCLNHNPYLSSVAAFTAVLQSKEVVLRWCFPIVISEISEKGYDSAANIKLNILNAACIDQEVLTSAVAQKHWTEAHKEANLEEVPFTKDMSDKYGYIMNNIISHIAGSDMRALEEYLTGIQK